MPDDALNQALDYLKTQIQEEKRSPAVKAFAGYVLALNDALDRDTFNAVSAQFARMDRESKILVLLAARLADLRPLKELQADLKPLVGSKAEAAADDPDDFRCRFRTPALALLAAQAIMPKDPLTQEEALLLLGGLDRQGIWTSTADTGWALLALGSYFKVRASAPNRWRSPSASPASPRPSASNWTPRASAPWALTPGPAQGPGGQSLRPGRQNLALQAGIDRPPAGYRRHRRRQRLQGPPGHQEHRWH